MHSTQSFSFKSAMVSTKTWFLPVAVWASLLALLVLSSKVAVPMAPVPATLQNMAVIFIALLAGWRMGVITVISYLALGALGLPVFANDLNPQALWLDPSLGYLIGFPLAAGCAGYFKSFLPKSGLALFGLACFANVLIYASGMLWLGHFVGGLANAFTMGVKPFLGVDLIKFAVLAVSFKLFRRIQSNHV